MSIGTNASQAFVPNKLAGLQVWLDASDIATVIEDTMAGFVSEWRDKSKEGNHALQPDGAPQPATGVNTINGHNVLTFDGGNDQLILPRVVDTDWTIIVVYRPLVAGDGSDNWFNGDGLFDMEVGGVRNDFGLSLGLNADLLAGVRIADTTIVKNTDGINNNYMGIFTRQSSSGDIDLYVNGSIAVSGNSAAGQMNAANRITIGSLQTNQNYFNGYIAEVIAYDNVLSEEDRNQVENYLANKWGITFDPLTLPGLKLWLDASDTSTILEDDTTGFVSQWNDKSLEGNFALQTTGTAQPGTGTRTINGLNVIDFDGGNDRMDLDSQPILGTEARTVIIVGFADDGGNINTLINLSNTAGTGARYAVTAEIAVRIFNGLITLGDSAEDGVGAIIMTTNEANSTLENNTSNFQGYKNGVLLTGSGPATTIDTGVGTASIGNDTSGSVGLDGVIGEIIIYDRVLSAPERQQIENYLSAKWGIPTSFPQAFSREFSSEFN